MAGKIWGRCWGWQGEKHDEIHRKLEKEGLSQGHTVCPKCGRPWHFYLILYHKGQRYQISGDDKGHRLPGYEEALQVLSSIRYEIKRGIFDPSRYVRKRQQEFTFRSVLKRYLQTKEHGSQKDDPKPRPYTFYEMRNKLTKIWVPIIDQMDIRDIREEHLECWRIDLEKRYAASSVQYYFKLLHGVFSWCHRLRTIERIPVWPELKVSRKEKKWLTEEQQQQILEVMDEWHRPIFRFMFEYGSRPSESAGLQWEDIDIKYSVINLNRRMDRHGVLSHTKTSKSRRFVLSSSWESYFKRHRGIGPVFRTRRGKAYHPVSLGAIWRRACKRAGIEGVTLYEGTRHSFISQKISAGHSIDDVSKVVGHSDVRITQAVYDHSGSYEASRRIFGKVIDFQDKKEAGDG